MTAIFKKICEGWLVNNLSNEYVNFPIFHVLLLH